MGLRREPFHPRRTVNSAGRTIDSCCRYQRALYTRVCHGAGGAMGKGRVGLRHLERFQLPHQLHEVAVAACRIEGPHCGITSQMT